MLDKSVPFYNIIMRREKGLEARREPLPEGFSFASYAPGDETAWSEIEESVLEFDHSAAALEYFKNEYYPFKKDLKQRLLFIQNRSGEKIATALNWWHEKDGERTAALHWVAVKTGYQGMGLGKALVAESIRRMRELEGDTDIYLHTQTWSYRAVHIYQKAGFKIVKNGSFHKYRNDYEKALPILIEKMGGKLDLDQ